MSSIITTITLSGLGPLCRERLSRGHLAALRFSSEPDVA